MSYVLENTAEAERLKLQDSIEAYDLKLDLGDFDITPSHKVLDAGCGAGIVSLFLKKHFGILDLESCDFSDLRMKQAEKYLLDNSAGGVSFFQCDLEKIPKDSQTYDRVICRFVYEYLQNPLLVTSEFYRVCKVGGKVRLIDLDGVVCNFQTNNSVLTKMIDLFTARSLRDHHLDFFAGRKLFGHMRSAGFQDIQYQIRPMQFVGADLEKEILNYRERFVFARPLLETVFEGPKNAQRFIDLYLAELQSNESVLFYNNFAVTGSKK